MHAVPATRLLIEQELQLLHDQLRLAEQVYTPGHESVAKLRGRIQMLQLERGVITAAVYGLQRAAA